MSFAARALETRYRGHRFRSRLEARWAVAFDAARIDWDYEPEGFALDLVGPYLPDFLLKTTAPKPMWCEVKPTRPTLLELQKARALAVGTGYPVALLIGKPAAALYWAIDEDPAIRPYVTHLDDGSGVRVCPTNLLWKSASDNNAVFSIPSWTPGEFGHNRMPPVDSFPMPMGFETSLLQKREHWDIRAIDAAASARFEHGESGAA